MSLSIYTSIQCQTCSSHSSYLFHILCPPPPVFSPSSHIKNMKFTLEAEELQKKINDLCEINADLQVGLNLVYSLMISLLCKNTTTFSSVIVECFLAHLGPSSFIWCHSGWQGVENSGGQSILWITKIIIWYENLNKEIELFINLYRRIELFFSYY